MKNEQIWFIVLIVALVAILFGGFGSWWGMPMMGYWTGGFGFMWIFMILLWILIIVFLVLGIIWLVKQLQKK